MTQIVWIARHGNRLDFVNPEWFNTAEFPYDPPLSEDGFQQAKQLGQRLVREKIVHIFASPFLRTVQTANEVANILNLPIKLESGLSEWLNPAWMSTKPERLPQEVLKERFPCIDMAYTSRIVPHYPETNEGVLQRTAQTIQHLTTEFSENMLLVGHGASVVGCTQGLVDSRIKVQASLCCLVKLVHQEQGWIMELNGDTSHLAKTEEVIRFH